MAAEPVAPALARAPPRRRQHPVFAAAPAGPWHPEAVVAALRAGQAGTAEWLEFVDYPGSQGRTLAMRRVVQLRAAAEEAMTGLQRRIEDNRRGVGLMEDIDAACRSFRNDGGADALATFNAAVAAQHPPALALLARVGRGEIERALAEARQIRDWFPPAA